MLIPKNKTKIIAKSIAKYILYGLDKKRI